MPAAAADPLAPQEDWLPRVVPPGLAPPPAARIPPIAVIETGFDPDHPDMAGGWVEQRRYGPYPSDRDAAAQDDFYEGIAHGTAVAGVIGAPRDGRGIEGILPGARVWVYGSSGLCQDVAAAIRQAVRDGARVINASYGFGPFGACHEHRDATSFAFGAGATVVAASGNFRPTQPWIQPGNDLHVLTVNALNAIDQPTGFSHQNLYSDLSAPGEGIFVAVPVWADVEDGVADGYSRWDGTSFAAPMVSAAAAWVLAQSPRLSADQVAEILRRSARDIARPGWDISTGWGALDLGAAVRAPTPPSDPYEPNDDIRWISGRSGFEADAPFLRTAARAAVRARIDVQKDPVERLPALGAGPRTRLGAPDAARHGRRPLRLAADCPQRQRQGRHRQEPPAGPVPRVRDGRQRRRARREGLGRGPRRPRPGPFRGVHARAVAALARLSRPRLRRSGRPRGSP